MYESLASKSNEELCVLIQKNDAESEAAMGVLYEKNTGLIHKVAHNLAEAGYISVVCDYDDIVQEAAIGLFEAARKWNQALGTKFSTYALEYMRGRTRNRCSEMKNTVTVSRQTIANARNGRTSNAQAVSNALNAVALNAPIADDTNAEYLDYVPDNQAEDAIAQFMMREEVTYLIKSGNLTKRELKVIDLMYLKSMTELEIADLMGCSRQNVNQSKRSALRKLKIAAERMHRNEER